VDVTVRLGLSTRLGLARLLFITDCRGTGDLAELADAALGGGVDMVQLRDPSAGEDAQLEAISTLRGVAHRDQGLIANYGDVRLAAKANADVLQLSAFGPDAASAHAALHRWALVGRSCHSVAEVGAAIAEDGVDFFTVSPVFNTAGVGRAGLTLVAHAAKAAPPGDPASRPWFAVGGINAANLDQVLAAGARRIGVTRAIATADDPHAAAEELKERLRKAWNDDPAMEQVTFSAFSAPPRPNPPESRS
jgi:thiamine-phosphate pyrophosphorylase